MADFGGEFQRPELLQMPVCKPQIAHISSACILDLLFSAKDALKNHDRVKEKTMGDTPFFCATSKNTKTPLKQG